MAFPHFYASSVVSGSDDVAFPAEWEEVLNFLEKEGDGLNLIEKLEKIVQLLERFQSMWDKHLLTFGAIGSVKYPMIIAYV